VVSAQAEPYLSCKAFCNLVFRESSIDVSLRNSDDIDFKAKGTEWYVQIPSVRSGMLTDWSLLQYLVLLEALSVETLRLAQ
jgi:hypothetical protein